MDTLYQILDGIPRPIVSVGIVLVTILVAELLASVVRRLSRRAVRSRPLAASIVAGFRNPLRLLFPLVAVALVLPLLELRPQLHGAISHILQIGIVIDVAWLVLRALGVTEHHLLRRYDTQVTDNLRARKMHTQVRVLRRIIAAVVFLLALSIGLMTFEAVRQIGTTLLASAGVLGVIVGLAAQRSLSLILAGLQVALAQPIRIDDVVVVEGEWGRIEEITLTFVVVKIWDRRRMVLPVSYFIEKPFENWTRVSSQLLGSVYLYVDYGFPVAELREKLHEYLRESTLWDGEAWVLQVVDATEKSMVLRALMTARTSPILWDLRCEIREKLITFIQEQHPEKLPFFRASLDGPTPRPSATPAQGDENAHSEQ